MTFRFFLVKLSILLLFLSGCGVTTDEEDPNALGPQVRCSGDNDCSKLDKCRSVGCVCRGGSCFVACKDSDGKDVFCGDNQICCQGVGCINHFSNESHCGGCNKSCGKGQNCLEGKCVLSCEENKVVCGVGAKEQICVDIKSDPLHCGGCVLEGQSSLGTVCELGESCVDGKCVASCDEGQVFCVSEDEVGGGKCSNTQEDKNNCGGCLKYLDGVDGTIGVKCQWDQECQSGICKDVCEGGQKPCLNADGVSVCVDTQRDMGFCGGCLSYPDGVTDGVVGKSCVEGKEECVGGVCKEKCSGDGIRCVDEHERQQCKSGVWESIEQCGDGERCSVLDGKCHKIEHCKSDMKSYCDDKTGEFVSCVNGEVVRAFCPSGEVCVVNVCKKKPVLGSDCEEDQLSEMCDEYGAIYYCNKGKVLKKYCGAGKVCKFSAEGKAVCQDAVGYVACNASGFKKRCNAGGQIVDCIGGKEVALFCQSSNEKSVCASFKWWKRGAAECLEKCEGFNEDDVIGCSNGKSYGCVINEREGVDDSERRVKLESPSVCYGGLMFYKISAQPECSATVMNCEIEGGKCRWNETDGVHCTFSDCPSNHTEHCEGNVLHTCKKVQGGNKSYLVKIQCDKFVSGGKCMNVGDQKLGGKLYHFGYDCVGECVEDGKKITTLGVCEGEGVRICKIWKNLTAPSIIKCSKGCVSGQFENYSIAKCIE